jgi:hypothetical protein
MPTPSPSSIRFTPHISRRLPSPSPFHLRFAPLFSFYHSLPSSHSIRSPPLILSDPRSDRESPALGLEAVDFLAFVGGAARPLTPRARRGASRTQRRLFGLVRGSRRFPTIYIRFPPGRGTPISSSPLRSVPGRRAPARFPPRLVRFQFQSKPDPKLSSKPAKNRLREMRHIYRYKDR